MPCLLGAHGSASTKELILVRTLCSGLQCQETTLCLEGQLLLHPLAVSPTCWPLLTPSAVILQGSICTCISADTDMREKHQIHQTEAAAFVLYYMSGFSHPWKWGHYFEFVFNLRRLSQHLSRGFRSVNVARALIQPWQVNLASFASSRLLLYLKYGPFWPRRHFTWIWDGFRISDVTIVSLLIWGFKKVTTDVCIVQMSSRLF